MSGLPIVELPGEPHADGVAHGAACAAAIADNLRIYYDRFRREARLTLQETRDRARMYLAVIDRVEPDYGAAMRGIAEGAGISLDDVAVLNARYELLYSQYSTINRAEATSCGIPAGGCTAFAVTPEASADGHLYLGQNWDWFPAVRGVLLRRRTGATAVVAFTEAGIVGGKIGMNGHGLGLVINGLLSSRDDWRQLRTPFHVRTWRVLHARSLRDAVQVVTDEPRSCSANFLIGQADGAAEVVNVEAAPEAACALAPHDGVLAHANHFVDPDRLKIWQPLAEEKTSTYHRARRMHRLLVEGARRRALNARTLMEILRDHEGRPESLCRHPNPALPEEERVETVVSVVEDLTARRLYVASGTPCTQPYQEIPL
ncbi:MAG: C45 family peptidase [Armatimonadota bacterium]|nr:C45 family peptidase [Armatimonadota bacterium]MDR7451824.1 C45 family peptidase [Armatimonadota bacterium]MDR7467549.1 C45 family peptidase [Armatimonadota bacterium]MDR7494490.1 C45 family peptidase [Armatimonadota bacterium]MDR7499751.1 C45 family peptidase [Armatimonadota bacterium]